jgi:hypothetical protein
VLAGDFNSDPRRIHGGSVATPARPPLVGAGQPGNICGLGSSPAGAEFDLNFVKIRPDGSVAWSSVHGGIDRDYFRGAKLAVLSNGDVVATWGALRDGKGVAILTKIAGFSGIPLWTNVLQLAGLDIGNPTAVKVDRSDNLIIGYLARELVVVKLDPDGRLLWTFKYAPQGGRYFNLVAIALDASGNVFAGGTSYLDPNPIGLLVKIKSDGTEEWSLPRQIKALAVLPDGGVVTTDPAYRVTRYDASGAEAWSTRYRGPAGLDRAVGIAVDLEGSIVVTGTSPGYHDLESYGDDYLTVKFDSRGKELWAARFDLYNEANVARGLRIDSMGNIYVSGDAGVLKYDRDGYQVWSAATRTYEPGIVINSDGVLYASISNGIQKFVPVEPAGFPIIQSVSAPSRLFPNKQLTFSVRATGAEPLNYLWRDSATFGSGVTGVLGPTFNKNPEVTEVWVEVSNQAGTVASPVMRLRALPELFQLASLYVLGQPAALHRLEISTNMVDWTTFSEFIIPLRGRVFFNRSTLPSSSPIFFRAIELPSP